MENVTVEFALSCMKFEEYTHILVRKKNGHRTVPVGGSCYSSVIAARYGKELLLSSFIRDNFLVLIMQ